MKKTPKKHRMFFVVLEALQETDGCALCELEARDMRRYLGNLLYENVNDVGVRANLVRSRGYCHRHAHMLLEFADGLGTAILYQDQVMRFARFLTSLRGLPARLCRKKVPESWTHDALCPACAVQDESRRDYLRVFLDWLGESDMRKAFDAGPGLCSPHLLLALGQAKKAALREHLIAAHVAKYARLEARLSEFMRKHDYHFSNEPRGEESDSWRRAVNMMTGRKDVF